ncbi:hypothetical protein D3878_05770 [Noviherbaspirillum sedimenti]|uniref:Uncharacterized protein n=1 Tax=Noviherbaspirillum sedimenti TaxID=2320865 RepID=A0A3A3GJM4_9BURK|nr:hypothetical protein D3878_05770 [Noviherbaspirillum sedimenti]
MLLALSGGTGKSLGLETTFIFPVSLEHEPDKLLSALFGNFYRVILWFFKKYIFAKMAQVFQEVADWDGELP